MESIATLDSALGTAAKLHRLLREEGLPPEALQWPIDDPEMRTRLVRSWNAHGFNAPGSPQLPTTSPFFANEEVTSTFSYPQGYAVRPVCEQLVALAKHFPSLDTSSVLACSKELPQLPSGAESWFAVPRVEKVAKTYNDGVELVLGLIAKTRSFYNHRKGYLGKKYLRLSERTATALEMLGAQQKGDFLLMPAQFGLTHRGRSVRKARINYAAHEFGLGSFIIGCMLLSHPERLIQWEQLHTDAAGDEFDPGADGRFDFAPCFFAFNDDRVEFGAHPVFYAREVCGPASGFLPQ